MTVFILICSQLLYNSEEAAEMLSISVRKLAQLAARGDLKPRRIDDCVRFYIGDLIQFASDNEAESKFVDNTEEASNDNAA